MIRFQKTHVSLAVLKKSIFHFGEYTIDEAKKHMDKVGIPVMLKR